MSLFRQTDSQTSSLTQGNQHTKNIKISGQGTAILLQYFKLL